MPFIFCTGSRVKQNVINKYHNKLINVRLENMVHQIHEKCWSIRQSKQQFQKLVMSIKSSKGNFWHILLLNYHMVISLPLKFSQIEISDNSILPSSEFITQPMYVIYPFLNNFLAIVVKIMLVRMIVLLPLKTIFLPSTPQKIIIFIKQSI